MQAHINALRVGVIVQCPADRGIPAHSAKVETFTRDAVNLNIHGVKYIWVFVRTMNGNGPGAWWPSHRLGYYI